MKTFRVYFNDGNQKLYEGPNMVETLCHIELDDSEYKMKDVTRIEIVEEDK